MRYRTKKKAKAAITGFLIPLGILAVVSVFILVYFLSGWLGSVIIGEPIGLIIGGILGLCLDCGLLFALLE